MSIEFLPLLYDQTVEMSKDLSLFDQWLTEEDFLAITPQVYSIFQQQERLDELPPFFQSTIKGRFKESFYQNLFIKNQTMEILQNFEKNKINVIPLKGVVFSEKYFGHLGARPTSDIDLLVKASDLSKAIHCVQKLGFHIQEQEIKGHFHSSFSKLLPGSPIPLTVELHWDLLQENTSTFNIMECWDQSMSYKSNTYVRELSSYHTFYMICLHSWRHNLDSLKHYLDIIQLIVMIGHEIDFEQLLRDAERHGTKKRIIRTLSAVYHECEFLEKTKPFLYKKESFSLSYEGKFNNRGNRLKRYADFLDYQFLSYDKVSHTISEMAKFIKLKN